MEVKGLSLHKHFHQHYSPWNIPYVSDYTAKPESVNFYDDKLPEHVEGRGCALSCENWCTELLRCIYDVAVFHTVCFDNEA